MIDEAITILATGVSAATGGASARSAIPTNSAGALPNYIRVSGRNECYVKVGNSTVVATGNDALVQPADSLILRVGGNTHIAYVQGTAAGQINVMPLEDV
jgi:hypothetical protein